MITLDLDHLLAEPDLVMRQHNGSNSLHLEARGLETSFDHGPFMIRGTSIERPFDRKGFVESLMRGLEGFGLASNQLGREYPIPGVLFFDRNYKTNPPLVGYAGNDGFALSTRENPNYRFLANAEGQSLLNFLRLTYKVPDENDPVYPLTQNQELYSAILGGVADKAQFMPLDLLRSFTGIRMCKPEGNRLMIPSDLYKTLNVIDEKPSHVVGQMDKWDGHAVLKIYPKPTAETLFGSRFNDLLAMPNTDRLAAELGSGIYVLNIDDSQHRFMLPSSAREAFLDHKELFCTGGFYFFVYSTKLIGK